MQSALVAGERLNEVFDLDAEKVKKNTIKFLLNSYLGKLNVLMLHSAMERVRMF